MSAEEAKKLQAKLKAKEVQTRLKAQGSGVTLPLQETALGMIEPIARTMLDWAYPIKRSPKAIDDTARAAAQTMTFNYADELAAKANEAMGSGTYEENVAKERARDEAMSPLSKAVGTVGGALATGKLIPNLGGAPTILAQAPRGAATGGLMGAAYGSGAAEEGGRLEGALTGAGIGAVTGGLTSGLLSALMKKTPQAPLEQLRSTATSSFERAHQSGIRLKPNKLGRLSQILRKTATDLGVSSRLPGHGNIIGALDEVESRLGSAQSIKDLHILRQVIQNAGKSSEAGARNLSRELVAAFDDYIQKLKPGDFVGAGGRVRNLAAVRELYDGIKGWSTFRKAETIEGLLDKAKLDAGNYSVSGMENAIRQQFKSLAKSPARMRVFTKEEQALIRKAAETNTVQYIARLLGKAAPRGVISGMPLAAGYAIGGAPAAAGIWAAGEGGKFASLAMRQAQANRVLELIKTGKIQNVTPEQAQMIATAIAGEQAGINGGNQ